MRAIRLIIIIIALNVSACGNNSGDDAKKKMDANTLNDLNNELKEFVTLNRGDMLKNFGPEKSTSKLFDFSKLYCENNGLCKVKLLGSDKYMPFSVANLISERKDYARLVWLMNDVRKTSELEKALNQGGIKSFNDKNSLFNAALKDSGQISMTINLFEDLQEYYQNKTLQLNK